MIKYFCDSCNTDVTNSTQFHMEVYCSKSSSSDVRILLCEGCFDDMTSVIGKKMIKNA